MLLKRKAAVYVVVISSALWGVNGVSCLWVREWVYLLVKQTVDNVEESSLLGIKNYEDDLKEKIWLIQAQNPGTAQYDKLG